MHRDRLVRGLSDNDWRLMGEGRLLLEQRTFDPVGGVAQTTQTLVEPAATRESRTWTVRVYTATELVALVRARGVRRGQVLGRVRAEPFTPDVATCVDRRDRERT